MAVVERWPGVMGDFQLGHLIEFEWGNENSGTRKHGCCGDVAVIGGWPLVEVPM